MNIFSAKNVRNVTENFQIADDCRWGRKMFSVGEKSERRTIPSIYT
jgi:hypothetical protein